MPLLRASGLEVTFSTRAGLVRAVAGVNLEVGRGETLAVLGESGSGKSVTALAIMGLVPPTIGITSGSVLFEGTDLQKLPVRARRSYRGQAMSMVFQDPLSSLNPVLTAGRQIGEMFRRHMHLSDKEARRRTIEIMDRVGIPDAKRRIDSYPHQFSGGMQQRVMIAMSLALKPRLLIADEPTTALDVTVQAQIMELLKDLQQQTGMALLLISHDMGVVADVADKAVLMYAGRVVERGPVRDVYDHSKHPYAIALMRSRADLGEKVDRLYAIPGRPPDPLALPPGCPYAPRCEFAREKCRLEVPVLLEVGTGNGASPGGGEHESACFYQDALEGER
jgi:oligopeptide/dipeptide ABC transporter ATP-binding protein